MWYSKVRNKVLSLANAGRTTGLAVEYVEFLAAVRLVTGVCGVYQIDNGAPDILHQISKRNSISVRSMYLN